MSNNNAGSQFQDTLDKIEVGLEAFEKLLAFSNGMSKVIKNYNVFDDVDESYEKEGPNIVKDFIKVGLDFVRGHPDADTKHEFNFKANTTKHIMMAVPQAAPAIDCPTEPGGQPVHMPDLNQADKSKVQESMFHLIQVDQKGSLDTFQQTPVYDTNKRPVETVKEVTEVEITKKKKKSCKKDRKQKRLLKFQETLVKTHGLPPSRLMVGKNLDSEFEQIARGEAEPASSIGHDTVMVVSPYKGPPLANDPSPPSYPVPPVLMPGQPPDQLPAVPGPGYHVPPPAPVPPDRCQVPMPGCSPSFLQVTGTPSSYNQDLMLSSNPQYNRDSTTWPVGWSEARPMMGYRWDGMPLLPSGLPIGSTSGTYNFLALSPSPQSSIGSVPLYQPQPQPPSPGGSPAYCFHCMQYGAVFTIRPV